MPIVKESHMILGMLALVLIVVVVGYHFHIVDEAYGRGVVEGRLDTIEHFWEELEKDVKSVGHDVGHAVSAADTLMLTSNPNREAEENLQTDWVVHEDSVTVSDQARRDQYSIEKEGQLANEMAGLAPTLSHAQRLGEGRGQPDTGGFASPDQEEIDKRVCEDVYGDGC
jgi:hypothetical protein